MSLPGTVGPPQITVWETVTQMSTASFVMLAILLATIQAAMILGPLKWLQLRRSAQAETALLWELEAATPQLSSPHDMLQLLQRFPDAPCALVLGAVAQSAARGGASYDELLGTGRQAMAKVQAQQERYLPSLAGIAATAPLLGLFGTVWGIIEAFLKISVHKSSELPVIAPAMSGALLTTALGLLAAMPAAVIHNYAGAAVQAQLDRLDALTQRWAGKWQSPSMGRSAVEQQYLPG